MLVLLIEDDRRLARTLEEGLEEEHCLVDVQHDGDSGLASLLAIPYDACILDINLPKQDGFSLLGAARQAKVSTPILALTARDEVADRVRGLKAGADDYLIKPFAFAELVARLHALMRRGGARHVDVFSHGPLSLHVAAHTAFVAGEPLALTPKQFAVLALLLRHIGQVVTRSMLLTSVWGYAFDPGTNLVDVHVAQLRRKLDEVGQGTIIQTIRGVGYRIDAHS